VNLKKNAFSDIEVLFHKTIHQELSSRINYKRNLEIKDFEKKISKSIRDNAIRNLCSNYKSVPIVNIIIHLENNVSFIL
jgi:hypothetical protein